MKFFKKNQVVIYVIALMLVVAGYLNYTTTDPAKSILANSNVVDESRSSNIGDAQLVSSNISENNESAENQTNTENVNDAQNTENNTNNNLANGESVQTSENSNSTQNQVSGNQASETKVSENGENTQDLANEEEKSGEDQENVQNQNGQNQNTTVETSSKTADDSYFTNSKLERESMYSQMIETYEKVLNSTNALEVQKQSATEEITKINNTKNSIMICENLIGTKGFDKNVIFVNGDSVTVIIGATELKEEDVAQIQNIISRELNASIENIHIAIK